MSRWTFYQRAQRYTFGMVAASLPGFQVATRCDQQAPAPSTASSSTDTASSTTNKDATTLERNTTYNNNDTTCIPTTTKSPSKPLPGLQKDATGTFHGLFPNRQLWQPLVPYPLWDKNWDHSHPPSTGNAEVDRAQLRQLRKHGVTRHVLLIRHGQYDETHTEDEKRVLTKLGRQQAELTGRRLREMMEGAANDDEGFGRCHIRSVRVSGMARARETAQIIAQHLPGVPLLEADPMLNEGRPCHTLPGGAASERAIQMMDQHHDRIEGAFVKLFARAPPPDDDNEVTDKHEFEIIVCHANVIRYWVCRALQLPPEAWLRYCPFNCSITYLTIRPTGTVSCRMLGDIGHLPYSHSTFSMHKGYNW